MPWVGAAVAIGGSLISASAQRSAAKKNAEAAAAGSKAGQGQQFQPTATAAQQKPTELSQNPSEQMRLEQATSGQTPPTPPQNTGGGGGSNTLNNVNQAAQLGLTLQQIAQMNSGASARAQALSAAPRGGSSVQYQPTAGNNPATVGQDPRLQSLLGQRR